MVTRWHPGLKRKPATQSLGSSSAQSQGTVSRAAWPSLVVGGGVPEGVSAIWPPEFELSLPFFPAWWSTAPRFASDLKPVAPAVQKTVGKTLPAVLAAPLPAVPIVN